MADMFDSEQEERYQSYLNAHLKKEEQELPKAEQLKALQKRGRSKWWQLLINIAAILFFGYSFYFDITQLGDTLFIILGIVFGVNMGLILYQKKQINELITYLKWKRGQEE